MDWKWICNRVPGKAVVVGQDGPAGTTNSRYLTCGI